MVVVWPWIFRLMVRHKYFYGITIWPFVILRSKDLRSNQGLINHERIHLRQQLEMLIVPFYVWYFLEFLVRWATLGSSYRAYRSISFEQEAYNHEYDYDYLKTRRMYSWMRFVLRS